jgi:hypothetical protein
MNFAIDRRLRGTKIRGKPNIEQGIGNKKPACRQAGKEVALYITVFLRR